MPLIRLARDKRGLDTLYLLHQRGEGRGDARLRVLYFGVAPQGLGFGRPWLDPDTQRALERRYPDIDFDWPALLKEVEQRRLPPPVEPQARRPRPAGKAERRPATSEVPTEKPASGKRKRRRSGTSSGPAPAAAATMVPADDPPVAAVPGVAPIIES